MSHPTEIDITTRFAFAPDTVVRLPVLVEKRASSAESFSLTKIEGGSRYLSAAQLVHLAKESISVKENASSAPLSSRDVKNDSARDERYKSSIQNVVQAAKTALENKETAAKSSLQTSSFQKGEKS